MKFLDLNTGYSFDGLWQDGQQRGYVFWFPKEQSVNLTYTMPICIITESDEPLHLHVEENDIFSFITCDTEPNTEVDGYPFHEPIYSSDIVTMPEVIESQSISYYTHLINISASSPNVGEFICKINIGDSGEYIRVGADFYGEYEPIYINLSNFGVELPDEIQKAIYDSNVHEDIKDNVLMNRKLKELMSNYWDIIANKGSYKSLKNSLEWFEWDKNLKLKEIWKHKDADRTIFDDREILSILENKVLDSFTNFIKTTYVSIYCSLQDELDTYDSEYNPQLKQAVLKWAKEDIQLKLALLSKCFGNYFMPIHMRLMHSTVEDKVFTNTIKVLHGNEMKRNDFFGSLDSVESNIDDNATFKLTNVKVQVTENTAFGLKYPSDSYFGVDKFPSIGLVNDENIKTFSTQYYGGVGAIIPIKLTIKNQTAGDFIKETHIIVIETYNVNGVEKSEIRKFVFNDIFKVKENKLNVNFNFLSKSAKKYEMRFNFILASNKTITKSISFEVEDCDNVTINMYKVRSKDDSKGFTKEDFSNHSLYKYFYNIQQYSGTNNNCLYTQYLPYLTPELEQYLNIKNYNGLKLNRVIVVDLTDTSGKYVNSEFCTDMVEVDKHTKYYNHGVYRLRAMMNDNYLEFGKYDIVNINGEEIKKLKYLIFVSKKFFDAKLVESSQDTDDIIYKIDKRYNHAYKIIRDDLSFFPQFHYLEKMGVLKDNEKILTTDHFSLMPYEAFCCAVEINDGNTTKDFKHGLKIEDAEWTIENQSDINSEVIKYPISIQSPFIVNIKNQKLKPGYYNISFKYSLSDGVTNEYSLNSAFRINKDNTL